MRLEILPGSYSVCKLADFSGVDMRGAYCFLGKTDDEISLVCESGAVPANPLAREDGWRAFRIAGTLDFSLVGILAKISAILAEAGVGIFAVSTYNTDYILTKEADFERALAALALAGYASVPLRG